MPYPSEDQADQKNVHGDMHADEDNARGKTDMRDVLNVDAVFTQGVEKVGGTNNVGGGKLHPFDQPGFVIKPVMALPVGGI
jgi:hypothetical protein